MMILCTGLYKGGGAGAVYDGLIALPNPVPFPAIGTHACARVRSARLARLDPPPSKNTPTRKKRRRRCSTPPSAT